MQAEVETHGAPAYKIIPQGAGRNLQFQAVALSIILNRLDHGHAGSIAAAIGVEPENMVIIAPADVVIPTVEC